MAGDEPRESNMVISGATATSDPRIPKVVVREVIKYVYYATTVSSNSGKSYEDLEKENARLTKEITELRRQLFSYQRKRNGR